MEKNQEKIRGFSWKFEGKKKIVDIFGSLDSLLEFNDLEAISK